MFAKVPSWVLVVLTLCLTCPASALISTKTHSLILSKKQSELLVINHQTGEENLVKIGGSPTSLAVHGNNAYVSIWNSEYIKVIDLTTFKFLPKIMVGWNPVSLNVYAHYLFVVHEGENFVTVIDTLTHDTVSKIVLEQYAHNSTLHLHTLYVLNTFNAISVIDCPTRLLTCKLSLQNSPSFMIIHNEVAFIGSINNRSISCMDLQKNVFTDSVSLSKPPREMVVQGDYGYISSYNEPHIVLFNLNARKVDRCVPLGEVPDYIKVIGDYFYCSSWGSCKGFVYKLPSFQRVDTFENVSDLPINCTDTSIYLGAQKLKKRPEYQGLLLFSEITFDHVGDLMQGNPQEAFLRFEGAYRLGKFAEAKDCLELSLFHNDPKACAVAAYAYMRKKWGAMDTGSLWVYYFNLSDKVYFSFLCKEHG